jgi:hypothetical protein
LQNGLTNSSNAPENRTKITSCAVSGSPMLADSSAASPPTANQIPQNPSVDASITTLRMITTTHKNSPFPINNMPRLLGGSFLHDIRISPALSNYGYCNTLPAKSTEKKMNFIKMERGILEKKATASTPAHSGQNIKV